jgi:hypothetical protein
LASIIIVIMTAVMEAQKMISLTAGAISTSMYDYRKLEEESRTYEQQWRKLVNIGRSLQ